MIKVRTPPADFQSFNEPSGKKIKNSYPLFVKDVENLCNRMSINGIRSSFFVPEQRFDECCELIDVHSIVPVKRDKNSR